MADSRMLAVRLTVQDYAVVQRALVKLGEDGQRALTRISTAAASTAPALRQIDTGAAQVGAAMRRSGEAIRQVGFQLQDFVLQVQGGQSPFLALSQQGGQLAQALLGPKAALAATGVLIGAMVGKALLFKNANESVTDSEKKLAEALEATNKVLLSRQQQQWIDRQKQVAEASQKVSAELEKEKQKLVELEAALARSERAAQGRRRGASGDALPADADRFATSLGFLRTQVDAQRALVAQLGQSRIDLGQPGKLHPDDQKKFGPDPEKVQEVIAALEAERKQMQALADAALISARAMENVTDATKAHAEILKLKLPVDSAAAKKIIEITVATAELERQAKRNTAAREGEAAALAAQATGLEASIEAQQDYERSVARAGVASRAQIALLDGQAEAAARNTVEFDALTGTYRLSTRALDEFNREQAEMKNGQAPEEARRLAEEWARAKENLDRVNDSQRQFVERLNRQNELMQEPFKNAVQGIQTAFADMFEDIFEGSTDLFGSLKRVATRFAAEIATLLVFRPAVGSALSGLGFGGLAQQMGLSPFAQGALGSAGAGAGGAGGLGFLGSIGSFLGPVGLGAAAIGIPLIGGVLGKLFGGGGPDPDEIARQQFLTDLRQRQASVQPSVNAFIAGGTERSTIGRQFTDLYEEYVQLYSQLSELYNDLAPTTDQMAALTQAYNQRVAGLREDFARDLERQILAITDAGGEAARALADTVDELRKGAQEAGAGFQQVEDLIAALTGQARDAADRDVALSLAGFTGDPQAGWADLLRRQQERRRTVESLGGDLGAFESGAAAERLQALRGMSAAQRALLGESLSEVDQGLADLAETGLTAGEKLVQAGLAMEQFGQSIDEFLKGLDQSDLSPLSAGSKYSAQRQRLEETLAAARAGDAQAIARVPQEIQAFLTGSRGLFASGDQYSQDYAWATGLARQLGIDAPGLAVSLGQQGIAANQALFGGIGTQAAQAYQAQQQAAAAALAAAQAAKAPGLLAANQNGGGGGAANQNSVPGWQLWANAGGFTPGMADALVQVLYGGTGSGMTFAGAPEQAQNAVNALLQGDPYGYLVMGHEKALGTLLGNNMFSASDLAQRFGYMFNEGTLAEITGGSSQNTVGLTSGQASLVDAVLRELGGDQGGIGMGAGGPGATSNATQAQVTEALATVFGPQSLFSELAEKGLIGPQAVPGLPGLPGKSIADQIAAIGMELGIAAAAPDLMAAFQAYVDKGYVNTQNLKDALQALADAMGMGVDVGMGSTGLGGQVGTNATGNPADAAVGFSRGGIVRGGIVRGGIPGRDSVPAWLTPNERVLTVDEAAVYPQMVRAYYGRSDGDTGIREELRAIRQEIAALRAERMEADNDAYDQRDRIGRDLRQPRVVQRRS